MLCLTAAFSHQIGECGFCILQNLVLFSKQVFTTELTFRHVGLTIMTVLLCSVISVSRFYKS